MIQDNRIQQIYNEFRSLNDFSPQKALGFFTENINGLDSLSTFKDPDEFHLYVQLVWQYINALYQKGRYNEALDSAIKYLNIVDREVTRLDGGAKLDDWYYGILLLKGMSFFQLREFDKAKDVFKKLTKHDPANDDFKKWLRNASYKKNMRISHIITIISVTLVVGEIFFEKQIPFFFTRILLLGIGMTGFLATGIYEFYMQRSFRIKEKP